ncbi:MAG TPA: hypothetical protein VMP11_20390 [Verrucomicrobiae bacterium]|nr:hypothetical protein [Verrucomicrobiae bacterium]
MTTVPAYISVTTPVTQAIDRVKLLLFRPFDLGKWFTVGFGAWLATLGRGGGGGLNYSSHHERRFNDVESFRQWTNHARDYVMSNLNWILPLAIAIALFVIALVVLLTWLHSRGEFMFLHCVALNKAEIDVPWNRHAAGANSLFCFRIVVWLISLLPIVPLLAFTGITAFRLVNEAGAIADILLGLIPLVLMFVAVFVFFFLIRKLTIDFVVPIMFLRGTKCLAAWSEFLGLLSMNVGHFIVYLLFQIVLAIVLGMIVLAAFLVTCCIACCVVMIPYVGTVLLLPIFTFKRSYSLYYLAQFGPQYDVFTSMASPTPQAPVA